MPSLQLYTYKQDTWGSVEIFRPDNSSVTFMQGEDAELLLRTLAAAQTADYPLGVFQTPDALASHILEQYDTVK